MSDVCLLVETHCCLLVWRVQKHKGHRRTHQHFVHTQVVQTLWKQKTGLGRIGRRFCTVKLPFWKASIFSKMEMNVSVIKVVRVSASVWEISGWHRRRDCTAPPTVIYINTSAPVKVNKYHFHRGKWSPSSTPLFQVQVSCVERQKVVFPSFFLWSFPLMFHSHLLFPVMVYFKISMALNVQHIIFF